MLRTVRTLLPQCTRLCLHLNNYDKGIVDELKAIRHSDKLIVALAGTDPDTGEARELADKKAYGKHHWFGKFDGYYMTCDDDCLYPRDYVKEMVKAAKRYDNKAIITCCGGVYAGDGSANRTTWFIGTMSGNANDVQANFYGSAASIIHPTTIDPDGVLSTLLRDCDKNYAKGFVFDDNCVAVWANVYGVPIIVVTRNSGWLVFDTVSSAGHAITKTPEYAVKQAAEIRAHFAHFNKPVMWRSNDIEVVMAKHIRMTPRKTKDHVIVAMASHPPRQRGMLNVVRAMLPQCDKLCLYLNNYHSDIMAELSSIDGTGKIEAVLAGADPETGEQREHRDLRNHGKHFWVEEARLSGSYYFTVDDDIVYPHDYVDTMLMHLKAFDNRVIVTVHGLRYVLDALNRPVTIAGRTKYCDSSVFYAQKCASYTFAHECGNGVSAWHPKTLMSPAIRFTPIDTSKVDVGNGDDPAMAVAAQRSNVPIVRIPTDTCWVAADIGTCNISPLFCNTLSQARSAQQRYNHGQWRLNKTEYPVLRDDCLVLGSFITGVADKQRNTSWQPDSSAFKTYVESVRSKEVACKILHNAEYKGFKYPDVLCDVKDIWAHSKFPDNPYYGRFFLAYHWLNGNKNELKYVFITDCTDVEMMHSPFGLTSESDLVKPGRIYVGDEGKPVGIDWITSDNNSLGFLKDFTKDNRRRLMNAGLVGGHIELVMDFLGDILSVFDEVYEECGRIPPIDMGVFNYVCYSAKWWPYIEFGRHVTSVFTAYDKNTTAWFRHK